MFPYRRVNFSILIYCDEFLVGYAFDSYDAWTIGLKLEYTCKEIVDKVKYLNPTFYSLEADDVHFE